jgi:hypothetical protein
MSKKLILPVALLLLIGITGFVFASQIESGIGIFKGWNLIYGFTSPSSLSGMFESSHIKAIYTYVPGENGYVRIYPNPENSKIDKYGDSYFEKQVSWVYSDATVPGELNGYSSFTEYWLEEPLPLSQRPLSAGWNFVGITPDMKGKSLNELKGSCNIEKVWAWNNQELTGEGNWDSVSLDNKFNDYVLMKGIVVKVSNNCELGGSGVNVPSVPQIPN